MSSFHLNPVDRSMLTSKLNELHIPYDVDAVTGEFTFWYDNTNHRVGRDWDVHHALNYLNSIPRRLYEFQYRYHECVSEYSYIIIRGIDGRDASAKFREMYPYAYLEDYNEVIDEKHFNYLRSIHLANVIE